MNKKKYMLVVALVALIFIMSILIAGCKKAEAPSVETVEDTAPLETTIPVTTGPGVAYNDLGEPEFNTTEVNEEADETTESIEQPTTLKPAESKPTEPKPTEPKATEPKPTEPKDAESTTPNDEPNQGAAKELTEYEKYLNMSGDEQTTFIESFATPIDFFNWLNDAKTEHEAQKPGIIVGDGIIDLEKVSGS